MTNSRPMAVARVRRAPKRGTLPDQIARWDRAAWELIVTSVEVVIRGAQAEKQGWEAVREVATVGWKTVHGDFDVTDDELAFPWCKSRKRADLIERGAVGAAMLAILNGCAFETYLDLFAQGWGPSNA